MTRADFYDMRIGEFFEAMDAFQKEAEAGRKHAGNLIRGLCFRIFNLFVSRKDKMKDESKFWPMPWDEREETAEDVARGLSKLSAEERQAKINEFLRKIDNVGNAER